MAGAKAPPLVGVQARGADSTVHSQGSWADGIGVEGLKYHWVGVLWFIWNYTGVIRRLAYRVLADQ